MITLNLEDNPPRPKEGEGDVVVKGGPNDVVLTWKGGDLVDVKASDEAVTMTNVTVKPDVSTGAILCYRCAVDTDSGAWWCWQVICGT